MKKRYLSLLIFVLCDFLLSIASVALSLLITVKSVCTDNVALSLFSYFIYPLVFITALYVFKIYNILWRYSGLPELLRISAASLLSASMLYVAQMAVFRKSFSLSGIVLIFFFGSMLIFAQRLCAKYLASVLLKTGKASVDKSRDKSEISGNIMLIGGGSAGEIIINEIKSKSEYSDCRVRCIIDDDPYKQGLYISGIKIVGGREEILRAAEKFDISVIVFAIPGCDVNEKKQILNICQRTDCQLKIVPAICRMYGSSDEVFQSIRPVAIEDLLGRDPIEINSFKTLEYVCGKTVLVTGGGGTIGSELCRQLALHEPKLLIIFDIYENNAYQIQNELAYKFPKLNVVTLIGSVRDSKRLDCVFKTYRPQIVYHAAAHKHVPLMEDSPNEAVKNNVFGTLKTAKCADTYGAERFVLISTDKAVNPTNVMGASKRICEMLVQTLNRHSDTDYVAVRFGNVLGSNGSVIPLFKSQIAHGGPVTVTHPDIIRYFMTIPEAVALVLQAGANAKGGEIFVLDMGEPVKILDLAEKLIKLSGFTPYKDIDIKFTGLRPGEKLYEELLMSEEGLTATDNSLIHIGKPIDVDEALLFATLDEMKEAMYYEGSDTRTLIKRIVPTYIPKDGKKTSAAVKA